MKKRQIFFYEYNKDKLSEIFNFENINLNTQAPLPKDFNLDENRIVYLEKVYQESKKDILSLEYKIGIFIGVAFLVYSFLPNNYTINKLILITIISFILIGIIEDILLECESDFNVTPYELKTYLLYKEMLVLFNEKIEKLKNIEQKKEQERLKQQRTYWKKYWDEKQRNGFQFEKAVGELYKNLGYKVRITQGTGDGGVDIEIWKDDKKGIIQCKAHKHPVGPNDLRALWGVKDDFKADYAVFVAYSGVTSGAYEFTRNKHYQIIDVNRLINMSLESQKNKISNEE